MPVQHCSSYINNPNNKPTRDITPFGHHTKHLFSFVRFNSLSPKASSNAAVTTGRRSLQGSAKNALSKFSKFTVPRPVTGSHPSAAENPSVPHAGFVPLTISLNEVLNGPE